MFTDFNYMFKLFRAKLTWRASKSSIVFIRLKEVFDLQQAALMLTCAASELKWKRKTPKNGVRMHSHATWYRVRVNKKFNLKQLKYCADQGLNRLMPQPVEFGTGHSSDCRQSIRSIRSYLVAISGSATWPQANFLYRCNRTRLDSTTCLTACQPPGQYLSENTDQQHDNQQR